jgi:hypothetical protein
VAWKKESDTAAYHPIVLAPMAMVDWPERLTEHDFANMVWGFISRAATQSASFKTDYVVQAGTLVSLAGSNWRHWVDIAIRAGYLSPVTLDDGSEAWLLVEDSEDLFHIRRKAEIDWERQRRKDTNLPSLIVPVRLRDGDGCRYCGAIVVWGVQQGGRGGTYDHRVPGEAARSPDDLRVACRACNGVRADRPDADEVLPPRPAPTNPFYGEQTVALLAKHGHTVPRGNLRRHSDPAAGRVPLSKAQRPGALPGTAQRPGSHPGTAPAPSATPQPAGHRTPQHAPTSSSSRSKQRPGSQPDTAPGDPEAVGTSPLTSTETPSAESPLNQPTGGLRCPDTPGRVRDGTGTGRELLPPVPATARNSKRRSRGRRSRPEPRQEDL